MLYVGDNDFGVFEDMIDDMKTSSSPENGIFFGNVFCTSFNYGLSKHVTSPSTTGSYF